MKRLIIALMACLPLATAAQSTWELPQDQRQQQETTKPRRHKEAAKQPTVKDEDRPYLGGAVPEVDGRVVFTLDCEVPGASAEHIYNKVYAVIDSLTHAPNQIEGSRIAVVNRGEHTLAATVKEWLVFSSSFISIDQTEMDYTLIARAADHHLTLTMERIGYRYEMNRTDINVKGLAVKAEDWITDAQALNRSRTRLQRHSAKFRRKTVDRKDEIFGRVCQALGIAAARP